MSTLAQLRKQAKDMGIAAKDIRGAETSEELQEVIDNFSDGGSSKKSAPKAVKKAVAKKKVGKKVQAKKNGRVSAAAKKSSSKSQPAAKKSATTGKVKRTTAAKTTTSKKNGTDGNSGRNLLDGVDFRADEGWNARDGSAPDRIIKALAKKNGNREKVFDLLAPDVWDFVGKKKTNGDKRTKAEALDMLAYRIARTAWDFAVRTKQHNPSQERVQYGTGGTGQGIWKPVKARKAAAKGKTKTATAKRGAAKKNTTRKPARRATARR